RIKRLLRLAVLSAVTLGASVVTGTDLAHFNRGPLRRRTLWGKGERLLAGRAVEEEETADQLFGFGERTIGHAAPAGAHVEPHRLGAQRVAAQQDTPRLQARGVLEHPLVELTTLFLRTQPPLALWFHDQQHVRHE